MNEITSLDLRSRVTQIVSNARVTDIHTHLFPPSFGELQMSGADHVMTYHYLIAESLRVQELSYEAFWALDKASQAELIWKSLYVERSPLSEATSGVLTIAQAFQLKELGLTSLRHTLMEEATDAYVEQVMDMAGVESLVMTNDPLDETEAAYWRQGAIIHPRFHAALRLDSLLNHFEQACATLQTQGYNVQSDVGGDSILELHRFLTTWVDRMNPLYLALSATDAFMFPEESVRGRLLADLILPFCAERQLPLALMIGARRQVNKLLKDAGDSLGKASIRPIERLCEQYPGNRFLVTLLSRENQHELAVAARKFRNLMPFGCWWFLNTASLVDEITRMRLELLGPSFIPQHSDARVLEHLLYKWKNSRAVIATILYDKYQLLENTGWHVSDDVITRDVDQLFNQNFWSFVKQGRTLS